MLSSFKTAWPRRFLNAFCSFSERFSNIKTYFTVLERILAACPDPTERPCVRFVPRCPLCLIDSGTKLHPIPVLRNRRLIDDPSSLKLKGQIRPSYKAVIDRLHVDRDYLRLGCAPAHLNHVFRSHGDWVTFQKASAPSIKDNHIRSVARERLLYLRTPDRISSNVEGRFSGSTQHKSGDRCQHLGDVTGSVLSSYTGDLNSVPRQKGRDRIRVAESSRPKLLLIFHLPKDREFLRQNSLRGCVPMVAVRMSHEHAIDLFDELLRRHRERHEGIVPRVRRIVNRGACSRIAAHKPQHPS